MARGPSLPIPFLRCLLPSVPNPPTNPSISLYEFFSRRNVSESEKILVKNSEFSRRTPKEKFG